MFTLFLIAMLKTVAADAAVILIGVVLLGLALKPFTDKFMFDNNLEGTFHDE